MNFLGVRLNVLIGPDPVALPAPPSVLEALQEIEVTHSDRDRSGFRLTFALGRGGPTDLLDYELVANPLLQPNVRVILTVIFDVIPRPIMDGIVKQRDIVPGDQPGQGRLVLTGEDVSVALDRETRKKEHPAQDETIIANMIALNYAQYALIPMVIPPTIIDPPIPIDRVPQQNCTDWAYLKRMAKRFGYVRYVDAGPAPFVNTLYWGPPVRPGIQQKTLNVNLGPETNASNLRFTDDAMSAVRKVSAVNDRLTGKKVPVRTEVPLRFPLGLVPTALTRAGSTRVESINTSGLNAMQAFARAQGEFDASVDNTITVNGTLDSVKYNDVLRARSPVDLRGAGFTFDGTYLVRSVTHHIARGKYTQDFRLSRAELGAKAPMVRVG